MRQQLFTKHILIVLFISLAPCFSYGQNKTKAPLTREVNISSDTGYVIANTLIKKDKIKVEPDKMYYWYRSNEIRNNIAGFYGTVLHGDYMAFNFDDFMVEKGSFEKGLKTGTWYSWYTNGNVKSLVNYNNGQLDGECFYYSDDNKPEKELFYKDGKLDGIATIYLDNSIKKIKYKEGKELKAKVKKDKTKKKKNKEEKVKKKDNEEKVKDKRDKKEKNKDNSEEKGKEKAKSEDSQRGLFKNWKNQEKSTDKDQGSANKESKNKSKKEKLEKESWFKFFQKNKEPER